MVAGLAPGRAACTWMVGKSTWGRSLTDSARYAMMPNKAIPSINRLVAMGRRMNGSETFIGYRVYHLVPPRSNLFQHVRYHPVLLPQKPAPKSEFESGKVLEP